MDISGGSVRADRFRCPKSHRQKEVQSYSSLRIPFSGRPEFHAERVLNSSNMGNGALQVGTLFFLTAIEKIDTSKPYV